MSGRARSEPAHAAGAGCLLVLVLVLVLVLANAGNAGAQPPPAPGWAAPPADPAATSPATSPARDRARRTAAPLWQSLADPTDAHAGRLHQQALQHVRLARRSGAGDWLGVCRLTLARARLTDSPAAHLGRTRALAKLLGAAMARRAHLENALQRLDRALELQPNAPALLLAAARTLAKWEQPGPLSQCSVTRRDAEAIEYLRRLRRMHPDHNAGAVASELGILYTRMGHFTEAARAYREAATLSLDGGALARLRTNLGEVTMLSGDVVGALTHYERAAESTTGGRDYLLALWGQAIALDRLGEHELAVSLAQRAIEAEGGHMRVLRSDGVFFEPPHEIHYYEALGHEASAALRPMDAQDAWASAATSWRAYLDGAPTSAPDRAPTGDDWAATAGANLQRVLERSEPQPGPRTTSAVTLP